jgi:hypothetical protein
MRGIGDGCVGKGKYEATGYLSVEVFRWMALGEILLLKMGVGLWWYNWYVWRRLRGSQIKKI